MRSLATVVGAIGALAIALTATIATPQTILAAGTTGISGTWTGIVTQVGSTNPYSVIMTVSDRGGTTDYPELNCAGRLTPVGSSNGYAFFIETITHGRLDKGGRCIDGSITIAPAGKRLAWGWIGAHGGDTLVAYSTLTR